MRQLCGCHAPVAYKAHRAHPHTRCMKPSRTDTWAAFKYSREKRKICSPWKASTEGNVKFYLLYSYTRALYKLSPAVPAFCSARFIFVLSVSSSSAFIYCCCCYCCSCCSRCCWFSSTRIKFIVNASSSSSNLAKTSTGVRIGSVSWTAPVHSTNVI